MNSGMNGPEDTPGFLWPGRKSVNEKPVCFGIDNGYAVMQWILPDFMTDLSVKSCINRNKGDFTHLLFFKDNRRHDMEFRCFFIKIAQARESSFTGLDFIEKYKGFSGGSRRFFYSPCPVTNAQ